MKGSLLTCRYDPAVGHARHADGTPRKEVTYMKALAAFPSHQQVKLIEAEPPRQIGTDEVLLRVLDVGLCGTDREICSFEYGTPPSREDHLVIGHEALGEVVEVGSAVGEFRAGDLAVPTVRRPCPHQACRACRAGHQDYCYTGDFTERGIKEAHGFLTEYVVVRAPNLVPVPVDLSDVGVLTEPLTIAEKAMAQVFWLMQRRPPWLDPDTDQTDWGAGLSAVVLGAGPVGVLGAMVAASAGFRTYVYSRELPPSPRIELIEALGVTYVSSQSTTPPELAASIGNIDLIYEAAGHSQFALQVLKVLGQNGVYILTGVPGLQAFIQADPASLMRRMVLRNQVLLGTVNAGPEAFAAGIRHLQAFKRRWPQPTEALIGGRYPVEQAGELIFARPVGIKTVISFRDVH
jgi:threonine dehydrogenase-like Zn-dependent dehydrogenase